MKIPLYRFCLLLFVLLVSSCSITNRRYMPGYQVEWKNNSLAVHQNAVINKSIEKTHQKNFPLVASNAPQAKPIVGSTDKTTVKHKNIIAHCIEVIKGNKSVNGISLLQHRINNIALAPSSAMEDDSKNNLGIKLAKQSLLFGIFTCIGALGFGAVILYSVITVTQRLILYIVIIGLVVMALAFIAYFKGRRAMPLLFGDDTVEKYYNLASVGKVIGYTAIICLLLSLVAALAFFN